MTELSVPVHDAATFFSEGKHDLSKVAEGKETSQHSSGKKKGSVVKSSNTSDDKHQERLPPLLALIKLWGLRTPIRNRSAGKLITQ